MPLREGPPEPPPPQQEQREGHMRPVDGPPPYPAEKARGGEIILRNPMRRLIFIGGLIALVVVLLALRLVSVQN